MRPSAHLSVIPPPPIFHVLIIIYSSGKGQCLSTVYFSDRRGTVTLFAGSFVCSPFHMMAFLLAGKRAAFPK